MPADPIRGRWTIHVAHDGRLVSDLGPRIASDRRVEVVPVPDDQAIERAVRALDECNWRSGSLTLSTDMLVRAVLAAALEQPE